MSVEREGSGRVLVVGGGIAGMGVAMHLAELGHGVMVVERGPAVGGSMHLLDHTFPTDSCGLCLMLPRQPSLCPTLELERRVGVRLVPYAEVEEVEGVGGRFVVRLRHKARYVSEACDGCGACAAVCPEVRPHDHEGMLAPVKAVYRPAGLRAVPERWVVDMAYCTRCGACVAACPQGAIDLDEGEREEEVEVEAVVLAPGYRAFDARRKGEYGYGVYRNVVTALEFERQVSLAGSSGGRLARPSDGGPVRRVAFVHCVGSRDRRVGAEHCSSVCCMYTAKQVKLAKRAAPGVEVTVFHMDLRAMGKGYEKYLAEVQGLAGVKYRRAMPSRVHERQQTHELVVGYVGEDGRLGEEAYDLVVLAVGFGPPAGMAGLARRLGVELDGSGFAAGEGYGVGRTGREGVFVAGAFAEPKDIPDTVAEAAGVAGEVAAYLREAGSRRPEAGGQEEAIPPRDVSEEEPRVGVFVCACGGELSPIDIERVVAWAGRQRGVAVARRVPEGCTPAGQVAIEAAIAEERLNRVVVAGCGQRGYGEAWERLVERAGLDARLLEWVALREQVAWPHRGNGAEVTGKACSMVGMAVARLRAISGLAAYRGGELARPVGRAMVIGGGAAGMSAALGLARLGVEVELVERGSALGGQWREIRYQPDGSDVQGALAALSREVGSHPRIRVHLGSEVKGLSGRPGHYRTTIATAEGEQEVEHGAVVVATGGRPATTSEYLYGRHRAVITQRELEARLANGSLPTAGSGRQTVVMVQCVGSREEGRPYCSRVCCTQAVKNALRLKRDLPGTEVYVLFREVRTFGRREAYYEAAREAGVVFLRYELPEKPEVEATGEKVRVRLREPVLGEEVSLTADLLVLSVGMEAEENELAGLLGVQRDGDGFFAEEHAKMKPLDLGRGGMFVAGLAQGPRFLDEALAQGAGAAMRAAMWLAAEPAERPSAVWVNERLCSFCGLCVEACPYGARVMDDGRRVAVVDVGLCAGCGVCAVVCPNKATKQKGLEHGQLMAALDVALV